MKYVGVSTPAYTIPHTKKTSGDKIEKEEHTPNYPENIEFLDNSDTPYWTFPKNEKIKKGQTMTIETPGPGAYLGKEIEEANLSPLMNYRRKNAKKPFISGTRRFTKKRKKQILGPGSHNIVPKTGDSAVKFSFGYKSNDEIPIEVLKKIKEKKRKSKSYNPNSYNEDEEQYEGKITPGPGDYNPQYTQIEISKKTRFPKAGVKNDIEEKNKILKSSKKKISESTQVSPGPGDYDIKLNERELPSTQSFTSKIGTFGNKNQKRFKEKVNEAPGVGSYLLDNDTIKTRVNEMRRKGVLSSKDKEKLKKIHMMRAKTQKDKINSYKLKQSLKNEYLRNNLKRGLEKGYSIGNGLRPELAYIDMEIPGPGKYLDVYKRIHEHLTKRDTRGFDEE